MESGGAGSLHLWGPPSPSRHARPHQDLSPVMPATLQRHHGPRRPPGPVPRTRTWAGALFPWTLVCCMCFGCASSKYVEGNLVTPENWAFVARFCFLSDDGTFEYKIEYDREYAVQNLLLYYDSSRQWPAVYKTNKTCEEKEGVLSLMQNQVVNLTEARPESGCILQTIPPLPKTNSSAASSGAGGGLGSGSGPGRRAKQQQAPVVRRHIMSCHNIRRFRSARERWWFLAISNCNATKGLNLRYRFAMTNGPPGDYWHQHFSADEFYILPTLMFFSIAYLMMIIAIVMCTVELRARQLLHATYKIFLSSVVLQSLGVLFQSIAYIRFAVDGFGYPRTRQLGRLMEAASETTFLLLLLLLAKGYTVTRGRLRVGSSIKLTIFMCLYVVTYVALFIYEREFFDPGEVLYLYESPAGYGLMVLRIVAWWMFVYSTVFTLKHYPEKATFYYPFNLLATLWFVAGPCFIMSANSLIDKWVRESVVYAVLHSIAFLGHLQFLILTRPSKANKNFPFHVRTTQIAVMETVGMTGTSSMYHFGHHAYAPGGPQVPTTPMTDWMHDVPVGLFTVSRAVADLRAPPMPRGAPTQRRPYPTAPPTAPEMSPPPPTGSSEHSLHHSLRHSQSYSSSPRSSRTAVALGADMAGGDARVGDGRESPPGVNSPRAPRDPRPRTPRSPDGGGDGDSGSEDAPAPSAAKAIPRDPQMFIAPSQRRLPSGGSAGSSGAGTDVADRGKQQDDGGGGGGLQRGPGSGVPLGGSLDLDLDVRPGRNAAAPY